MGGGGKGGGMRGVRWCRDEDGEEKEKVLL